MRPPVRVAHGSVAPLLCMAMMVGAVFAGRPLLYQSAGLLWAAVAAAVGAGIAQWVGRRSRGPIISVAWPCLVSLIVAGVVLIGAFPVRLADFLVAASFSGIALAWCRSAVPDARESAPTWRIAALIGAAILVHQVCRHELYGHPVLLTRAVAFAVLLLGMALWFPAVIAAGVRNDARNSSGSLLPPALAFAGALLALVWALAVGPGRGWEWRVRQHFLGDDVVEDVEEIGDGAAGYLGGDSLNSEDGRSLPKSADIALGDGLRAVLRIDDREHLPKILEQPIYVRTLTLSRIDSDGALKPLRRGEWRYDYGDGQSDGQVDLHQPKPLVDSSSEVAHTLFVEGVDGHALPVLAGRRSFQLDQVYEFADDWYQLALNEDHDRVAYRARSDRRTFSPDDSVAADWVAERSESSPYLELPTTPMMNRLRTTAEQLVGDRSSLKQTLESVREFLAAQSRYSLSYENPDDLPAVENFLYGERRGHCELFAASTVMLLRSLNIPSRVAYGYSGGEVRVSDGVFVFRERDLHAWTEVLVKGQGWIIFDTTPPGDGARVAASTANRGAGGFWGGDGILDLSSYQMLAGSGREQSRAKSSVPQWLRATNAFVALHFNKILLGLIAGLLFGWILKVASQRRKNLSGGGAGWVGRRSPDMPLPEFLSDFLRLWSERGMAKRDGQTLQEFVSALRESGHCGHQFDDMVTYAYSVSYANRKRNADVERGIQTVIDRFRRKGGATDR